MCRRVAARTNRAHARSCDKADSASFTWICDVEQLYTGAALVLDVSTRAAPTAKSSLNVRALRVWVLSCCRLVLAHVALCTA